MTRREAYRAMHAWGFDAPLHAWCDPALARRDVEMRALRAVGTPVADIAARCGISPGYARKLLAGIYPRVPIRKPPRPPSKTAQRRAEAQRRAIDRAMMHASARSLRAMGYSTHQIAQRIGLSQRQVWRIVRDVRIRELRGRARLPDRQGRPALWRDALAAAEGRACLLPAYMLTPE
ncbi:MAG: hypothetical protein KGJ54_02670 [Betaproteobacteria bacterium]|nr:hypothetical protein [Betaproteobacteria bacterium]